MNEFLSKREFEVWSRTLDKRLVGLVSGHLVVDAIDIISAVTPTVVYLRNTGSTLGAAFSISSNGTLSLATNWNSSSAQDDASNPSWFVFLSTPSDAIGFGRRAAGGGSYTEFMRLTSGGTLLIGTTTATTGVGLKVTVGSIATDKGLSIGSATTDPPNGVLAIKDGVTAPSSSPSGMAQIYIDTADGDLKIRFADGTVKTIVVDT